jgi:hypothetical protein
LGHLVALVGTLGALFVVIRNGQHVLGGFVSAFQWLRGRPSAKSPSDAGGIPKRTVILIPDTQINSLSWNQGKLGAKPILHVVGDFLVTNTWTKDINVPVAILRYRRGMFRRRKRCSGTAMVKDANSTNFGRYAIPPNAMAQARISFDLTNTSRRASRPFVADVILIDQFKNEHLVKSLVFRNTDHMIE